MPAPVPHPATPWLRSLVDHIQDAIVLLDGSGSIVYESPVAREILGVASEGMERVFGLDRIHPEEREGVVRTFERTISEPGAVARATYRFQCGDGTWRYLEAAAKNLLHDPDLQAVVITFRDVSERIHALAAAEQAGRARDEFLSRMSHELRTPLHAILGWAQLLQARDDPSTREAVEQIAGAGQHLLRLVEEALDLAAVREGRITIELRTVDVLDLCLEALELIRPLAAARDIDVRLSALAEPGVLVSADPGRLRQVIINLLSNAVKYNRFAGEVIIGWTAGETRSRIARIWVRDTGPGIPADRLASVFDRFERLGMDTIGVEGSGLGLTISSRLVQMMGGKIGVESTPGSGSEFWICLPRVRRGRRPRPARRPHLARTRP